MRIPDLYLVDDNGPDARRAAHNHAAAAAFISLPWKGEPLFSYETTINLINTTRTQTGLRVRARPNLRGSLS